MESPPKSPPNNNNTDRASPLLANRYLRSRRPPLLPLGLESHAPFSRGACPTNSARIPRAHLFHPARARLLSLTFACTARRRHTAWPRAQATSATYSTCWGCSGPVSSPFAEFTTMSRDYTLTDPERLELEAAPSVATDPRDVDDRASRSRSLSRSSSLRSGD